MRAHTLACLRRQIAFSSRIEQMLRLSMGIDLDAAVEPEPEYAPDAPEEAEEGEEGDDEEEEAEEAEEESEPAAKEEL